MALKTQVLQGHPLVAECAVVGVADDLKGEVTTQRQQTHTDDYRSRKRKREEGEVAMMPTRNVNNKHPTQPLSP